MGKRRDLDRLAHVCLKFAAVETAIIIKAMNASEPKKSNYHEALKATEVMAKTVASIMAHAENAKAFEFSNEDSNDMSIQDIMDQIGIVIKDDDSRESEIKSEIHKAAQDIAKKFGVNAGEVMSIKLDSEKGRELEALLKSMSKSKGK